MWPTLISLFRIHHQPQNVRTKPLVAVLHLPRSLILSLFEKEKIISSSQGFPVEFHVNKENKLHLPITSDIFLKAFQGFQTTIKY